MHTFTPALYVLILLLALAGLGISTLFALVYCGLLAPDAALLAVFYALGEPSCATVLGTPHARVFRVPNFVLGLAYYAGLVALALVGLFAEAMPRQAAPWLPPAALVVALLTVALGDYLVHALRSVPRMPCRLCHASHAINVTLAVLQAALVWA